MPVTRSQGRLAHTIKLNDVSVRDVRITLKKGKKKLRVGVCAHVAGCKVIWCAGFCDHEVYSIHNDDQTVLESARQAVITHFPAYLSAHVNVHCRVTPAFHEFAARWCALHGHHYQPTAYLTQRHMDMWFMYCDAPWNTHNFFFDLKGLPSYTPHRDLQTFVQDIARLGMRLHINDFRMHVQDPDMQHLYPTFAFMCSVLFLDGCRSPYSQFLSTDQDKVELRRLVHFTRETTASRLYLLVKRASVFHSCHRRRR